MNHRRTRRLRAGFTLVELLIVIAIITALVALLLVGIWGAFATAKDARILVEIDQMQQAMEAYRAQYGDYPPVRIAGENQTQAEARIRRHVVKAFPRHSVGAGELSTLANLEPAEALVFWLGGTPLRDGQGGYAVEGFSANVANPFQSSYQNGDVTQSKTGPDAQQRTEPFFQFDPLRLRDDGDGDVFPVYAPPELNTPYCYFSADVYSFGGYVSPFNGSVAVPYRVNAGNANAATTWAAPQTFQIISAGLDDHYGTNTGARIYTTGQGFDQNGYDDDNLTNFSKTRIGKERE